MFKTLVGVLVTCGVIVGASMLGLRVTDGDPIGLSFGLVAALGFRIARLRRVGLAQAARYDRLQAEFEAANIAASRNPKPRRVVAASRNGLPW